MENRKLCIYVGCALKHAPDDFKMRVAELKALLKEKYDVMEFVPVDVGTATEVYEWDIHECVAKCDLFVAICDHPSLGLGYEISTAVEKWGKPVLAAAHKDADVSRLILGVSHPSYEFRRYGSMLEVASMVDKKISKIAAS